MTARTLFALAFASLVPAALPGQEPLDDLVKKEQAEVASEEGAVSVYGGKVGNADAIFFIEWAASATEKEVKGSYYLPVRGKNVRYVLKGTNPRSGVLELEEYLEEGEGNLVLNANCTLTKRVAGKRIVWEGEKLCANGRSLPISFSREK